jgi:hypothetical protein
MWTTKRNCLTGSWRCRISSWDKHLEDDYMIVGFGKTEENSVKEEAVHEDWRHQGDRKIGITAV